MCRTYTNEQKSLALVAYTLCNHNATATARYCAANHDFNVSADQITRWTRGISISADSADDAEHLKKSLADRAEAMAGKLLDRVEATIGTGTLMQASTSFAIMVDKMRLLREEPTSINASMRSLTPEQLLDEINAIIAAPDEDPKLKIVGGE